MMEEKNSFSIRNLVLSLLLVILFVFIMIWLFPTKSYINNNYVTQDELIQKLESIYGRNFASNIESMRDAAKDYFTNERMPKTLGDSVTLTLGEMLEKKLVLMFVDSNGNKCDTTESYVKLTKMENEYQLKVQLTCSDYSDYIIDYIGCYDYCDECEVDKTPVVKPTTKPTVTPKPTPKPTPETIVKKYKYEYKLTTNDTYSDWSNWSNWSTKKATANLLTQVEIDKRQVLDGYERDYVIVDYETETYTDYKTETYIDYETETYIDYETVTKKVADGTTTKLVDSINPTYSKGYYTEWKDAGTKTAIDEVLYSTDTKKYTLQSTNVYLDCEDQCKYVTESYYTVKTRKWVSGTPSCSNGYKLEGSKCNKYEQETVYKTITEEVPVEKTREVPVEKTREVEVEKTREVPVYGYENGDPIYKTVTYYRYRTRTQLTFAGEDIKWSESNNDATLLSKKYVLTGKVEEM